MEQICIKLRGIGFAQKYHAVDDHETATSAKSTINAFLPALIGCLCIFNTLPNPI